MRSSRITRWACATSTSRRRLDFCRATLLLRLATRSERSNAGVSEFSLRPRAANRPGIHAPFRGVSPNQSKGPGLGPLLLWHRNGGIDPRAGRREAERTLAAISIGRPTALAGGRIRFSCYAGFVPTVYSTPTSSQMPCFDDRASISFGCSRLNRSSGPSGSRLTRRRKPAFQTTSHHRSEQSR